MNDLDCIFREEISFLLASVIKVGHLQAHTGIWYGMFVMEITEWVSAMRGVSD